MTQVGYFSDMRIIDERLTNLEQKIEALINIVIRLEEIILCEHPTSKKENFRMQ